MNDSSLHVVESLLYIVSLMKYTASWEIMLGLQMGNLLDDGLNVAVYIGSFPLALVRSDLCTPVRSGVGFMMGGTIFGVLARVLRRVAAKMMGR